MNEREVSQEPGRLGPRFFSSPSLHLLKTRSPQVSSILILTMKLIGYQTTLLSEHCGRRHEFVFFQPA